MSKQIQGKFKEGKFYGYIEMLPEYEEIVLNVDKMTPNSVFSVYAKTNILNSYNFQTMMIYSAPSDNNYDVKGKTLSFYPTLSLRIKNIPKEFYQQGKKVITMIYIQSDNDMTSNDKLNMIVYPNVDHYERITPIPNKYIYSSLSSKDVDETVFSFKQQDINDNLLVIEVSSCRGNLGYSLTDNKSQKVNYMENYSEEKGKKVIVAHIDRNIEYYLSVYGLKEDQMLFSDSEIIYEGVDFLLFYYTTNYQQYSQINFDSKLSYKIKEPGHIILYLPNLETVNAKNGKNKLDDLKVAAIITTNKNEFDYMNSICYLTKKYEFINQQKLYQNYTITTNKNNNEIEIQNLDSNQNYYINVLITNKKTGQIFALDPLQLKPRKIIEVDHVPSTILMIAIVVLLVVIIYIYRKYRVTKALVNYESNDINNMGTLPKSITELKMMQEEKNKKAKEKYNSLTEDSGQV